MPRETERRTGCPGPLHELLSLEEDNMSMRHLLAWLNDRWLEHQAFKPRVPVPQGRSQVYRPIVNIADAAYWRWHMSHLRH